MEQSNQPVDNKKQNIDQLKAEAKKILTFSIIMALGAVGYYFYADSLDHRTGSVSVNVIILAVYNSLGTVGGTAALGGLSGVGLIMSVVKWMGIKKKETEV
jgi:hypothetical protein